MITTSTERAFSRIRLVSELTGAYVSGNKISITDLPELIASIKQTFDRLTSKQPTRPLKPRLQILKQQKSRPIYAQICLSVTPDALISFIDGRPYKTLRRHLRAYGLTPETYRAKYGLPADYPMVSPSYSERRATIARGSGFGTTTHRRGNDRR